jgi:SAM-dependent methyltransferase
METSGQGEEVKHRFREVFEAEAEHYATERERLPYFRAQIEIMLRMLPGGSGRILDLRKRGFSVVGIDQAPRMLQFAHRRFERDGQVHFSQADIDRLPFRAESMDLVVCLGVFEFLPDYGQALREIRRVLRPGGTVVFAIPSAISLYVLGDRLARRTLAPLWRIAKRVTTRQTSPSGEALQRNLCVPWRFHAMLKQHGLEPQQVRYSNYFLYPLDRFPKLDVKVAQFLEPLASVPLLRYGASVHLVSARLETPQR